mmetsp:Transcript_31492/g.43716  ORF Transcript_31492/g.43716 Transcript_31492/m.43716 type:complete len:261 (+) Transcript_31492:220-1002(+)|eukprot:CAMPEP_0196580354 /NCGR_PEP_ID=MMETSP1081-20130531/28579_1 /TAXON_ID=36882 /ORGANISM="Pyramimonas amylifera, Strain CCMP720" /LENGTH=260 /DNA_ID=CAMNT_0041900203 /DNA_START=212 /DNA_END=994 /DNA_ORIENTATION=-
MTKGADNNIQALYRACRSVFQNNSSTPNPEGLQQVATLIQRVSCSDLGVEVPQASAREEVLPADSNSGGFGFFGEVLAGLGGALTRTGQLSAQKFTAPVTYQEVVECVHFTIAVFSIPSFGTIPLHNHPGMVVMSKVLYGSMHVRSYDWLDSSASGSGEAPRPARLVRDEVVTGPSEVVTLFPNSGGNIHAFTALTPCAVLDILAPPYDPNNGRDCTYYSEFIPQSNDLEFDAFLGEVQAPDDFVVKRLPYNGFEVDKQQ